MMISYFKKISRAAFLTSSGRRTNDGDIIGGSRLQFSPFPLCIGVLPGC